MNITLKNKLINIAKNKMRSDDPSHDINHTLRVLALAEKICIKEKADMDIVVASAIFHDVINYPKNHPKRLLSSSESAVFAKKVLKGITSFPVDKINKVYKSIELCSFSKGANPDFIEAKIIQDADSLEAIGAISIMRTFSSAGQLSKMFYNDSDPFCIKRKPDDQKYALDLFYTRLLVVQSRLHTKTAKTFAKKRTDFLKSFLDELKLELLQIK